MKQATAYASIKKVATMLACHGPHDNRIRGMLNHHGATTGRWTNSLVQFQNMKRPTPGIDTEGAYRDICGGISREMLDLCYGPPLEVISSCIRHFVQDTELVCGSCGCLASEGLCPNWGCEGGYLKRRGKLFNNADYAAVEARIVAWLAGQEDALEEYRSYDAAESKEEKNALDPYRHLAALIYGVSVAEVNKFPQRNVGKHAKLGCGYGLGAAGFRKQVKKQSGGYDLPLGLEETAVAIWRSKHKKIVSFWYNTERAAKRAIVNKGKAFQVDKVTFLCRDIEGMCFLLCQLPSKRKLAFPQPRISADQIVIFGNTVGNNWGDIRLWGGDFTGRITQAVAADLMAIGATNSEKAGYEIATLIHDEALAYHKPGQTPEEFVELLTDMPSWADGLPIAAEGSLVPFYKKD
jgi:DNA polymerase